MHRPLRAVFWNGNTPMPIRNLSEVFVPEGRIRREISPQALEELIQSILSVGLLHPPVVEANGALLAGERRFRALQEISRRGQTYHSGGKFIAPHLIATTDIRELTQVERLQAELEENTIRVDVTWQEKAEATARLMELKEMQAGLETRPMTVGEAQAVPLPLLNPVAAALKDKDESEVTRGDQRDVKADLIVDAWIRAHPDDKSVVNAKSRPEALKAIEVQLEDEYRVALAKRFKARSSGGGHIIQQIDMIVALEQTPDGVYDVICTDPPWGVGANRWNNGDSIRRHSYTDDFDTFESIHTTLAKEGFRVCKPKAHLYLFCEHQKFEWLGKLFRSFGWDVWPRPLIWFRSNGAGIPPRPEHGPKNTYETILFANKGDKRVVKLLPDVIAYPKPAEDLRAAAKPAAVYYNLLSRSVVPGDDVLDPCCGSGPIIPAATALSVRATAYDVGADAIGLTSSRLDEKFEPREVEITLRAPRR